MADVLQSHIVGTKNPEREVQEPTDANWIANCSFQLDRIILTNRPAHGGRALKSSLPRKPFGWLCKQAMEKMLLELDAGKENGRSLGVEREGIPGLYLSTVEAGD